MSRLFLEAGEAQEMHIHVSLLAEQHLAEYLAGDGGQGYAVPLVARRDIKLGNLLESRDDWDMIGHVRPDARQGA